jgi:hypothetical protein
MPTDRSRWLAACAGIGAVLVLGSGPTARAAVGSIDFKEMKVGLSHAHHRPMPPIIVVQRMNGEWKASALPVQFELSIFAKVDTFSSIFRLLVGVPSIEKNNVTAWTAGFAEGSAKVELRSTTFSFPGDALALSPLSTGDLCAESAAGRGNDFLVSFRLPIEVQVAANRGMTNVEQRFKTYAREIDAAVRCVVPPRPSDTAEQRIRVLRSAGRSSTLRFLAAANPRFLAAANPPICMRFRRCPRGFSVRRQRRAHATVPVSWIGPRRLHRIINSGDVVKDRTVAPAFAACGSDPSHSQPQLRRDHFARDCPSRRQG